MGKLKKEEILKRFADLSVRSGIPLSSLVKSDQDYDLIQTVLFCCAKSYASDREQFIQDFLLGPGSWIKASQEEIRTLLLAQDKTDCSISLQELQNSLQIGSLQRKNSRIQWAKVHRQKIAVEKQKEFLASDALYMQRALEEACDQSLKNEIPVGAIVVAPDGSIVGKGKNRTRMDHDPTAHAEIVAIRQAAKTLGNSRLPGCTIYVTLEPCAMCAGAILHSRFSRLVYGASDPKTGVVQSVANLFDNENINHHTTVTAGILEKECSERLAVFFQKLRCEKDVNRSEND